MKGEIERVLPCGRATIRFDVYDEGAEPPFTRVCAVDQLTGEIHLPPKQWLALVRGELRVIERLAQNTGCAELRFVGRFSQRIFPDYEAYQTADDSIGLRKRLR